MNKTIHIYFRKKTNDKHSIENLFDPLIAELSRNREFSIRKIEMPHSNEGLINKIKNIFFTLGQKADIHHIAGDIHYISLALVFKKTIITVHDLYFIKDKNILKSFLFFVFWIYIPFFLAIKIIAISDVTQKKIVSYYRSFGNKTTVIPNFVREEFLSSKSNFASKSSYTILHIGTKKNKNLEGLILAMKDLPLNLIVIGKLTDFQKVLLHKYRITFQEEINLPLEKMIYLYATSGMLHFASLSEGFGLPILEAQCLGLPVITSDLSPMKDVAGPGAILVHPHKPEEIRAAIIKLHQNKDLMESIINKGYQNVKNYTINNVAQKYLNLYRSMSV